jgi:prepilin-type N-terminal cleavage/methylation domain-containing protein
MKSCSPVALRRLSCRGFTLLELLVVMVIIGILAALTLGAFRYAQESAARNRTIATHATISAGLEQYKEKFGEYPEPANEQEREEFGGNTLNTGGAHMLYQALTADGSSAIRLQTPPPGGAQESDGQVDDQEMENSISSSTLPKSVIFPPNAPAGESRARLLVDGWNRPFQYTRADPPPAIPPPGNQPPPRNTVNPTYDLWSYGPLTTESSVGSGVETKLQPEATAKWIKNW